MRGGYRERSGRSKSGYYNGIYCGSTYELCWLIYAIDNNIKLSRFSGILSDGQIKYIPDFILDDKKTIIEIKGYESKDLVDKKTNLAERMGYTVVVLRKHDLQDAFEHVKRKFNTTQYHTLYDGYKPSHEYICVNCNNLFSRDKQLKTDSVFCSRSCSIKHNRKKLPNSKYLDNNERSKHFYNKNKEAILKRRRELYKLKKTYKKMIEYATIIKDNISNSFNVADAYKHNTVAENQNIVKQNLQNFSVCCINVEGDLNVGATIRTSHLLGATRVLVFGRRRIDNRSLVGAQNYTDIIKINGYDANDRLDRSLFDSVMAEHDMTPIFIEQGGTSLEHMDWNTLCSHMHPCFILGNESSGIPSDFMTELDIKVGIPQIGILRSYNVATAASIVMWDYIKTMVFNT